MCAERLGWLGDINVFAPTASYLRDTRAFMEKFTADMRDAQFADGSLPGVAPYYTLTGGIGGTAWEDAMVTVPFAVYKAYGDTDLVQQNWDAMTKFMAHVQASAGADLVDTGRNVYGDWLTLESDTPAGVIGTAGDQQCAIVPAGKGAGHARAGCLRSRAGCGKVGGHRPVDPVRERITSQSIIGPHQM